MASGQLKLPAQTSRSSSRCGNGQMILDPRALQLASLSFLVLATPATVHGFCTMSTTTPKKAAAAAGTSAGVVAPSTTLAEHAVAWASAHGMGVEVKDNSGLFTSSHIPFSLLPYGE